MKETHNGFLSFPNVIISTSDTHSTENDPPTGTNDIRVLSLDDADGVIGSLASETARSILQSLHNEPATASDLADSADTTIQNVGHHLESLQAADLVEVVETRYSVKGREMDVYAPTDDRVLVCVDDGESGLIDSLQELVGVTAALGVVSAIVQRSFRTTSVTAAPETAPRVPNSVMAEPAMGLLSPGLAFFLGGLLVLTIMMLWSRRNRLGRLIPA